MRSSLLYQVASLPLLLLLLVVVVVEAAGQVHPA
jgi:hypothetical protein